MIFSHRKHEFPLDGIFEMDRAMAPPVVMRSVRLRGFVHDDGLTIPLLGFGTAGDRARAGLILAGRVELAVAGVRMELGAGDAIVVPDLSTMRCRYEDVDAVEIDWDLTADERAAWHQPIVRRLEPQGVAAARALAHALRIATPSAVVPFAMAAKEALGVLWREGLACHPSVLDAHWQLDARRQHLGAILDEIRSRLDAGPQLVDIAATVGGSRRTVVRRIAELNTTYRLCGLGGTDWRALRDFDRLLVGTILMSHRAVTTRSGAAMLGYSSAEAFCHAFANVGLPSPGAIRSRVRTAA